jgi:hypothetical protein
MKIATFLTVLLMTACSGTHATFDADCPTPDAGVTPSTMTPAQACQIVKWANVSTFCVPEVLPCPWGELDPVVCDVDAVYACAELVAATGPDCEPIMPSTCVDACN